MVLTKTVTRPDEPVEIGRSDVSIAVRPNRICPLIVGKNEENVGWRSNLARRHSPENY
jgi:hypothetical protein